MSGPETATAVHVADMAVKAMFPGASDLPALHRLSVRARLRLDRGPSVDVLLDLLASCDTDVYAEVVAANGFDPLGPHGKRVAT